MFNIVLSKTHNKRDGNNFEMLNFLVLDGDLHLPIMLETERQAVYRERKKERKKDVPRSPSYGVFILQLIRFERVCSNVYDFNIRKSILTAYLLKQCYRYHKIRKSLSKFRLPQTLRVDC